MKNYPQYPSEAENKTFDGVYLYGEVNFGSAEARSIIGFPIVQKAAATFDLLVCYLPGLHDLKHFKELITSTTYVVEIHHEDVHKRAFHQRNVDEFNRISSLAAVSRPPSSPAKGKAKGKGAPVASSGPPVAQVPVAATAFGPPTAGDLFLLEAIGRALHTSRSLRPHGAVRFKLEPLLSSSNDELAMFERKKNGRKEGDDIIVVKVISHIPKNSLSLILKLTGERVSGSSSRESSETGEVGSAC